MTVHLIDATERNRRGSAPAARWLRRGLGGLMLLLATASSAAATTDDEARAACMQHLAASEGAENIADIEIRRHDGHPYVYGNADFGTLEDIHFRCKVIDGHVQNMHYLVQDSYQAGGRAWSAKLPPAPFTEPVELDEAAKAPPPLDPAEPHFQRVPQ